MERFLSNLALYVLSEVYRLFVITKMWSLILVPLGAVAIGLKNAFLIGLLIQAFLYGISYNSGEVKTSMRTWPIATVLGMSIIWFLAWIIA